MLHHRFLIENEHASQAHALILNQYPIVPTHFVINIAEQRDIDLAQATILSRDILPVPQRVLRIDRNENNIAIAILEFFEAVLESEHLGRAHERECCGYEKNDEP